MKNKFVDLNNHLFEALERINDIDLEGAKLTNEIKRAQSISNVARQIIGNANLVMKAKQMQISHTMTTTADRKLPDYFNDNPNLALVNDKKKQG